MKLRESRENNSNENSNEKDKENDLIGFAKSKKYKEMKADVCFRSYLERRESTFFDRVVI